MTFKVLTLNCWGLKYVSKDRTERIQGIATRLSQAPHEVIALQEIWVYSDYELIRDSCLNLPYSKFFYSGALGAGLAILSKYPIIQTSCNPYSLNGEPLDVAAGDWFVGKAAASAVVDHPELGKVQIFNTHLFAKGGEEGPEHRRAHRLVNAWEFSKLTRQAAELGRHVIALGDFNSTPETLPMKLILQHAALADAWREVHPDVNLSSAASPQDAITLYGITADSPLNTYSAGKPLDPYARQFNGKRLDYVLYRSPSSFTPKSLKCTQCSVIMTDTVPGHHFSFSDHFGLEATFDIEPSAAPRQDATSGLLEVQEPHSSDSLSPQIVSSTMQALVECLRFSRYRARRELLIFAFSLVLLLGLVIGSSWLPKSWINPIFVLFTIFISWLATTMLYSGFIFGKWESNALMNVLEDLEILQRLNEGQTGGRYSNA